MTIQILSNGGKYAGQEPDTIEQLIDVLANHPLDRTFEKYGNFVYLSEDGKWNAFGNFLRLSHVFRIEADTREELGELEAAIRVNQQRPDYMEQQIKTKEAA